MTLALQGQRGSSGLCKTCWMRALGSEQGKNDSLPAFLSLLGTSCLLHHLPWVLSGQLYFCVWARQREKHFGSAPCLSRVQHYQGSRLVSSISRCLSLLRSQVSSQDFLAPGKIECLSEPPRPVFHLQQPGPDWVTVPALRVSPSPSAWPAEEALCILFLALQRKEAPSFHPRPASWVYCSPSTCSEVALPSKSEQFLPVCKGKNANPKEASP